MNKYESHRTPQRFSTLDSYSLMLKKIILSFFKLCTCSSLYNQGSSATPDSSASEESACNAGDSSLIPGSGRSPGEGIGYPLQYSWVSLVAQLVKNLPAM